MQPLSVNTRGGKSLLIGCLVEEGNDIGGGCHGQDYRGKHGMGIVVNEVDISTPVPSARRQWVMSDCQVSLGRVDSKRVHDFLDRF